MRTFALNRLKEALWVLAVSALVVGVARMFTGLGASSYMADPVPWGFWKIVNMVAGAALATGGFIVACIIYVFQLNRYRPLARVGILIAFLGYGSSLTALLFDIGLPWRFWHPFFMWNPHSFLFEVFWCVSCYWGVTAFEMLPVVFERLPWPKVTHFLHEIALPIIVLGITLSTMHHSSLGSLFMVSPTRLHPLWFSTWIPIEFLTSAMGAGMFVIVLVSLFVSWLYGKKVDLSLLQGMAKAGAWTLVLYAVIRAVDFTLHGKWRYVFGPDITWESLVFGVEVMLQVVLPAALIAMPSVRKRAGGLFAASAIAALGLVMHRVDVGIVGFFRSAGQTYFPSLSEFALGLGIPAAAGIVFFFLVEHFYIFESPEECAAPETEGVHTETAPQFTLEELLGILRSPGAFRVGLAAVITVPLIMLLTHDQALSPFKPEPEPVQPPLGLKVEQVRADLKIDGNRKDEFVIFPHKLHQEEVSVNETGREEACDLCHHLSLPQDNATPCYRCHRDMNIPSDTFGHEKHQELLGGKKSCAECHDLSKPKGGENAPKCIKCHREDMPGLENYDPQTFSYLAPGYKEAMHQLCLTCHRRYGREKQCMTEPDCLGNCKACHNNRLPRSATAMR